VQVTHRFDHRQQTAGEHPLGCAHRAVLHQQLDAAEAVGATVAARGRDGVGDERDTSGGCAPDERCRRGREMDPVEDDLDEDVVPYERGADDPGSR
jgi:hypothetical protein